MSNKPFDRSVTNNLERPLSSDVNLGQTYWATALVDVLFRQSATRLSLSSDTTNAQPPTGDAAFFGSAFKPRGVSGSLQVSLDAGIGFYNDNLTSSSIGNVSGVNDNEIIKPLVLTAAEVINIPAADPTNPRIDLIEVQSGRQFTDATSRDVFNPSAAAFQPQSVNKTLSYYLGGRSTVNGVGPINYKTGAPAAGPSAPAVDSGYRMIAQVYVPANATALGATSFMDLRRLMLPGGTLRVSGYLSRGPSGALNPAKMLALSAPPGVEATVIDNAGSPFLYVKPGDASKFRVDSAGPVIAGSVVTQQTQPNNLTPTLGASVGEAAAAAADTAAMAAGSPPVYAMVGQPILFSTLGGAGASGTTLFFFDLSAQY